MLAAATSVRELEKQLADQRVASARRIRILEAQLQVLPGQPLLLSCMAWQPRMADLLAAREQLACI